ncbi:MAG: hypothetical protein EZS28_054395 [Streblomastix strix]|uniref:Uncharacterized protein n=1 Tax=Streblomastix strix TaxID=222440 RepID=A0A5J4QPP3_9EUKA|nr:MAG: hypothetical protein EZS28_054395 [Streblomastix strix]
MCLCFGLVYINHLLQYTIKLLKKLFVLEIVLHYPCRQCFEDLRIMFDDNPDPQVLSLEVIGEISGSAIRSG